MTDVTQLYSTVVLDHGRNPRHRGVLADATHSAFGDNPLCGDKIEIFVIIEKEKIKKATFEGQGCALCLASTSVMCGDIEGMEVDEVKKLVEQFRLSVLGPTCPDAGKKIEGVELSLQLQAFSGVQKFPMRVKCALLPWHALKDILK